MKIIATFFKYILFIMISNVLAHAQTQVIEAGVGGHSTSQMLGRINTDVLTHNPETTIVLGGTNDMLNSGKLATIEQFSANIISIIDQLQAINSEVILLTIPPCIEEELLKRHDASAFLPDTPNGRVIKANEALAQIAIDKGVLLLDTYTLFNDNLSLLSSDGVHPSATGYQTMADLIYNTIIDNNYPSDDTVACFGDSITRSYAPVFASNFAGSNGSGEATGDWEILFETDGDTEGFEGWSGGTISGVSNGVLMFQGGNGIEIPAGNSEGLFANKDTHPIMAMQIDVSPSRLDGFVNYGWWQESMAERNNVADTELNDKFVYYWDFRSVWDGDDDEFPSGNDPITRMIFRIEGGAVNISWLKTFVDRAALVAYVANNPLSTNDVTKSLTKVISRENSIDIVKAEVNAKIEVFDLLGKRLHSSVAKSSDVSISLFSKGLHIIKISGEQSVITKKVILK